ncbi:MAG: SDR family oxidoreductase [Phycisphaerae bacterium]|jgi:NAD(P)-dependent dehydrogenase (short-subunit alcohol dehydrogenase family)|nr:SDR family oxidoreductase [Phycisphaerae bacterium]
MDLNGKLALVTGAAKRVGRSIALSLAGAGADVIVHYNRSEDDARATAAAIADIGRRAELIAADLAQPDQIETMFARIAEMFGDTHRPLGVLVNNASVYHRTPIAGLTAEAWDRAQAVNARGPALCIRHAIALMHPGAAIVNITDISAEDPRAALGAYCASKAALLAITKSAAKALAPDIRVNAVAPGAILWEDDISEAEIQRVLDQVPMKRTGRPEDIAAAVIFLCQNEYITAQTLRVDGGWYTG